MPGQSGPSPSFALDLGLNAGLPVKQAACSSHPAVKLNYRDKASLDMHLDKATYEANKGDVIFRYRLAGEAIDGGVLLYEEGGEQFFMMTMQPPERPTVDQIPPRDYLFIVDVSGSMNGFPIEVSKELMHDLLSSLRPVDRFNVLLFASGFAKFHREMVPVSSDAIRLAIRFIDQQPGSGGTELMPALEEALVHDRRCGPFHHGGDRHGRPGDRGETGHGPDPGAARAGQLLPLRHRQLHQPLPAGGPGARGAQRTAGGHQRGRGPARGAGVPHHDRLAGAHRCEARLRGHGRVRRDPQERARPVRRQAHRGVRQVPGQGRWPGAGHREQRGRALRPEHAGGAGGRVRRQRGPALPLGPPEDPGAIGLQPLQRAAGDPEADRGPGPEVQPAHRVHLLRGGGQQPPGRQGEVAAEVHAQHLRVGARAARMEPDRARRAAARVPAVRQQGAFHA
ncbi:MAG: hypothetical protein H6596_08935 [Flavobacteriales bacterium]|nr:hypothetical protein [Flavobacteriales bacterium]